MTASVALYDLSNARAILDEWLNESEGEVTPELEALLAELDVKADEKIERVALYIRERLARAAAVKEEVQRIQAIQKREEKAAESLKAYLHREMERLGKDKVNGLLCTVALQKNPPAVGTLLTDADLAVAYREEDPALAGVGQFIVEIPTSYRLDKDAVKAAAKNGDYIPPCITVSQGYSLRIR